MIELSEHRTIELVEADLGTPGNIYKRNKVYLTPVDFKALEDRSYKPFGFYKDRRCFNLRPLQNENGSKSYHLTSDYYVGLDWLIEDSVPLYIEPKMNDAFTNYFEEIAEEEDDFLNDSIGEEIDKEGVEHGQVREVDYLKMLLLVFSDERCARGAKNLLHINWECSPIPINSTVNDRLTPFLVVQFLLKLKSIVRKGLKKDFYKVRENLRGRLKGKVLVDTHVKKNVFKNRYTSTYCEYEVFGVDTPENRFLKKVLIFCGSFVENNRSLFKDNFSDIQQLIRFSKPAFQNVADERINSHLGTIRNNPFYKEYKEGVELGNQILKRFSFNLTNTVKNVTEVPPFWIDMPQLFELYFYYKLLKSNPEKQSEIHFQFSTYGNKLDFLISKEGTEMIIDTKYTPYYNKGRVHSDIRQVSGYSRLRKVRERLKMDGSDDSTIDCLIVYPKLDNSVSILEDFELSQLKNALNERNQIKMYYKVYKLGISLPLIDSF